MRHLRCQTYFIHKRRTRFIADNLVSVLQIRALYKFRIFYPRFSNSVVLTVSFSILIAIKFLQRGQIISTLDPLSPLHSLQVQTGHVANNFSTTSTSFIFSHSLLLFSDRNIYKKFYFLSYFYRFIRKEIV